jgi:hypothetical protein
MKKAFVAAAAVLLLAGASFAALQVEVDLDGTLGNGPDYKLAVVSENVTADIWIIGDAPCAWVVGLFLCNADASLEYVSTQYYPGPSAAWSFTPPAAPGPDGCITLQGQNFSFDVPMCWPWKVATVTYHAAVDHSVDDLVLGAGSGVLTTSFATVSFDNNETVVARVQIGLIDSVEETNWGAVKNLFR